MASAPAGATVRSLAIHIETEQRRKEERNRMKKPERCACGIPTIAEGRICAVCRVETRADLRWRAFKAGLLSTIETIIAPEPDSNDPLVMQLSLNKGALTYELFL